MRILVLSDSHADKSKIRKAVGYMRDSIDMVIHLGDGERDMYFSDNTLEGLEVIQVRGNCDLSSLFENSRLLEKREKVIFCTHGHLQRVKFTDILLKEEAKKYNADIILYGHTHKPVTKYEDSVYYFNPGSIRDGNFGYIDIVNGGIRCVNLNLNDIEKI